MVLRGGAVLYPPPNFGSNPAPFRGPPASGPGLFSAPSRSPVPSPLLLIHGPAPSAWPRPSLLPAPPSPRRAVPLAHAEVGVRGTRPPLVLLHGIFGNHGNFHTVAKALVRRVGGQVRPRGPAAEPQLHRQSHRSGGHEQCLAPADAVPPGWAGAHSGRTKPWQQPPQPADDVRGDEFGRAAPPDPAGHPQVHPRGTQHGWQDGHGAGLAAGGCLGVLVVGRGLVSVGGGAEKGSADAAMSPQ